MIGGIAVALGAAAVIGWHGGASVSGLAEGAAAFSDAEGRFAEVVPAFAGRPFLKTSVRGCALEVLEDGEITVLMPYIPYGEMSVWERYENKPEYLLGQGFAAGGTNVVRVACGRAHERFSAYVKQVRRGERYSFRKFAIVAGFDGERSRRAETRELVLPSGIRLPEVTFERSDFSKANGRLPPAPYLEKPPAVIDVTIGRQLFVDDFLIGSTTMKRTWHRAKRRGGPVLRPETDFERGTDTGHNPMSAPFSGGVWYDGQTGRYRCYYRAAWYRGDACAESADGLRWTRPDCGVEAGTNRVLPLPPGGSVAPDSSAVVLDPDAKDGYRWKAFVRYVPTERGGWLYRSKDGLVWNEMVKTSITGDRSTVFYNPFLGRWVYSCRGSWYRSDVKRQSAERCRIYAEAEDFFAGRFHQNRVEWLFADDEELPENVYFYPDPARTGRRRRPDLYNFDAVAYESVMLGVETLFPGLENDNYDRVGRPKPTDLHLAFSRNGFDFTRPEDRTPFLACTRRVGDWDCGYLHSNAGVCVIVGDELRFYYTGFAGDASRTEKKGLLMALGSYANGSMGIATLRRDGFASMDAPEQGAVLETRPMRFTKGDRLYVNAAVKGRLRAELLDEAGGVLASGEVTGDSCMKAIAGGLGRYRGRTVRIRFSGRGAELYSFWFSDASGHSGGYLAAGSPGHATLRDL